MSRIGRKPVAIPAGVDVKLNGHEMTVKGPKGTLTQKFHENMIIEVTKEEITVKRPDDEKENRALHGLTRTLIANMVEGVTNGFSKSLEINGVGYRAQKQGKNLVMNLGYSHQVIVPEIPGITIDVPAANQIVISGPDKQMVGQFASEVRGKRPPDRCFWCACRIGRRVRSATPAGATSRPANGGASWRCKGRFPPRVWRKSPAPGQCCKRKTPLCARWSTAVCAV